MGGSDRTAGSDRSQSQEQSQVQVDGSQDEPIIMHVSLRRPSLGERLRDALSLHRKPDQEPKHESQAEKKIEVQPDLKGIAEDLHRAIDLFSEITGVQVDHDKMLVLALPLEGKLPNDGKHKAVFVIDPETAVAEQEVIEGSPDSQTASQMKVQTRIQYAERLALAIINCAQDANFTGGNENSYSLIPKTILNALSSNPDDPLDPTPRFLIATNITRAYVHALALVFTMKLVSDPAIIGPRPLDASIYTGQDEPKAIDSKTVLDWAFEKARTELFSPALGPLTARVKGSELALHKEMWRDLARHSFASNPELMELIGMGSIYMVGDELVRKEVESDTPLARMLFESFSSRVSYIEGTMLIDAIWHGDLDALLPMLKDPGLLLSGHGAMKLRKERYVPDLPMFG